MTLHRASATDTIEIVHEPPGWVTLRSGEIPHNVAFLSGASFAMLDMALQNSVGSVPGKLLANTLALRAAVATSKLEGRSAWETTIRDAFHFTPQDADGMRHWGPDGEVLMFWRNAVRIRLGEADWSQRVSDCIDVDLADAAKDWLEHALDRARTHGPLTAAIHAMRLVLEADDRAERTGCLISDVVQAKFFGWKHPLPITVLHLAKQNLWELKGADGEAELAIQHAMATSALTAQRLAAALAARVVALSSVAHKLRAKGSAEAVELFRTEDAVAPSSMLSPMVQGTAVPMTSRAARRLCNRLVELGVVKELTGRATFRLYGVGP